MNITYLSASIIPSRSANSVHVMKMCQAFVANGHKVNLIAVRGDTRKVTWSDADTDYSYYGVTPEFSIIKCTHPPIRWLGNAIHTACVADNVRKLRQPDLFYARNIFGLAVAAPLGVPMILELHDKVHHPLVKIILRRLFRQEHFRGLVVISKALGQAYRHDFPQLASKPIIVAHDAADAPVSPLEPLPHPWPGRPDHLQVGYTGHLYPGRGTEIILSAAQAVPEADFHIVGGTESDLERWRAQVQTNNIFFHGHVPHRMIVAYLARFDVVLAPYQKRVSGGQGRGDTSRWTSPLKIFEYMASGKAIVCSNLPVLREVLTDRVNALLVKPNDIAGWTSAIGTLNRDQTLRTRLGETAYQDFLAHHTWQKRAEVVLNFENSLRCA